MIYILPNKFIKKKFSWQNIQYQLDFSYRQVSNISRSLVGN